ncbi:MAG: DUF1688 family protein, partial [Pseudonocardiaceae bacterium]
PDTGLLLARSEGLALASLHAFGAGLFSGDPAQPLRADAEGLSRLSEPMLAAAFQVSPDNPLTGLTGRVTLLRRLGAAVRRRRDGEDNGQVPREPRPRRIGLRRQP